jgi:hypothetical protein
VLTGDNLHIHLVEVPLPLPEALHPAHPLATDVGGEQRAEAVPPVAHGLVADVDPALSGKRTYIITTRRITSGDELK